MAVINESIPRQNAARAERIPALSRRVQPGDVHAPISWAAVVADPGGGRVQRKPNRREGGMGAAVATRAAVPAAAPNAEAAPKTAASKATEPLNSGSQDLMQNDVSSNRSCTPADAKSVGGNHHTDATDHRELAGRVRGAKRIPGRRRRRNDGTVSAAGCQTRKRDGSHADSCYKIADCYPGITLAGAALLGEVRVAGLAASYKRCASGMHVRSV